MNSDQLKYFLAVAKHLNFTEASKDFYITQPAISHQISELESELGVKLFIRNTRNVTLTKPGELFLEHAKNFLDMEVRMKENLKVMEQPSNLELNIGYLANPCKHFLPPILKEYREKFPQVKINLNRYDAKFIQNSIETHQHDIYFSVMQDLLKQKLYQCRKIFVDDYSLVCRNDHPCISSIKIDYNKLAIEPFIGFSEERGAYLVKQVNRICHELNFNPRIVATYSSFEEILFAVECGLGITILPSRVKNYMVASLAYVPLDTINCSTEMGIAWLNDSNNPAIQWFLTLFNKYLVERPELF